MTPKEKANGLFDKYSYELSNHIFNGTFDIAKQCALITVNEILNEPDCSEIFWQEVKEEIEKI